MTIKDLLVKSLKNLNVLESTLTICMRLYIGSMYIMCIIEFEQIKALVTLPFEGI